jgi:hypothetical protein
MSMLSMDKHEEWQDESCSLLNDALDDDDDSPRPSFDDSERQWSSWSSDLLETAVYSGYDKVLTDDPLAPSVAESVISEEAEKEEAIQRYKESNGVLYEMSMYCKKLFFSDAEYETIGHLPQSRTRSMWNRLYARLGSASLVEMGGMMKGLLHNRHDDHKAEDGLLL